MTRTLAPLAALTTLTATLLACSAIWQDSTTTNALETDLALDQTTVVEVRATLAAGEGEPLVCSDLLVYFTTRWDGLGGHLLHSYDAEGELIELGELENDKELQLDNTWEQVGDDCQATRLIAITPSADDSGALTFDINATDTSTGPGDEPKGEVTLTGAVDFAPTL